MKIKRIPLPRRKVWKLLKAYYKKISKLHLRRLFAADPKRGERMTIEMLGLTLDYSKTRVTAGPLKLLVKLAVESNLKARIDAMFQGEKINVTDMEP